MRKMLLLFSIVYNLCFLLVAPIKFGTSMMFDKPIIFNVISVVLGLFSLTAVVMLSMGDYKIMEKAKFIKLILLLNIPALLGVLYILNIVVLILFVFILYGGSVPHM